MRQKINISEERLHSIIVEEIEKFVNENDAMGGGAAMGGAFATPGATSDSVDRMGQFDVPFGKPIKKNKNFYAPALERHDGKGGSIGIPKERAGEKKK